MRFKFRQLEKEHALAILNWRYTSPFDTDTIQEELHYLLDSKNAFYAILNLQGELEGYCSFGSDGQVPSTAAAILIMRTVLVEKAIFIQWYGLKCPFSR